MKRAFEHRRMRQHGPSLLQITTKQQRFYRVVCWIYDRTLVAASIGSALIHLDCGVILWFRMRQPPKPVRIAILRLAPLMMSPGSGPGPAIRPFHRDGQTFKERLLLERLAQKANSAGAHGATAVFLVGVSGNENDGRAISPRLQPFLEFETVQPWHLEIGNEAACFRNRSRLKKILRGDKGQRFIPQRLDELLYAFSSQRVVIDDRHHLSARHLPLPQLDLVPAMIRLPRRVGIRRTVR